MLEKVYNFIDDKIRGNDGFHLAGIIIGAGILFFALLFLFDTTPASANDYKPLMQQKEAIVQNFNTLYTYDNYTIAPQENNIKVTLSNDQCSLTCLFDKNLNIISCKEVDLAQSKIAVLGVSLFIGFIVGGFIGLLLFSFIPFVISYLLKFIEFLCLLLIGIKPSCKRDIDH